jgi:hypothetical protein
MFRTMQCLCLFFLCLGPILVYGQMSENGKMQDTQTVTGCLQKGQETGGYTITGDDGKVWELSSKKVELAEHVGHKVTLTGHAAQASEAQEKEIANSEQQEANGKEHGDLRVTSLKMVSDSCK